MSENFQLPSLPSDLILLGLHDLEKCEQEPEKYNVRMTEWYRQEPNSGCYVCLAGAVIAHHYRELPWFMNQSPGPEDKLENIYPSSFTDEVGDKLLALNYFRRGEVTEGLKLLNITLQDYDRPVANYDFYPKLFKQDLRHLAAQLKRLGF